MFLVRTAFWLGIVVMILPTDKSTQDKLHTASGAALASAKTFCDRNGAICDKSAQTWSLFKTKAEFGVQLALNLASGKSGTSGPDAPRSNSQSPRTQVPSAQARSIVAHRQVVPPIPVKRGTLRDEDRVPGWGGGAHK